MLANIDLNLKNLIEFLNKTKENENLMYETGFRLIKLYNALETSNVDNLEGTHENLRELRLLRSSRENKSLEKVERLDSAIYVTLATILFLIEAKCTIKLLYRTWIDTSTMGEKALLKFSDCKSFDGVFINEPEDELMHMPQSQLRTNMLLLYGIGELHFCKDLEQFEQIIETLFHRAALLMNFTYSKEDLDLDNYVIAKEGADSLRMTNFQFAAEMRVLFDDVFLRIYSVKKIQEKMQTTTGDDVARDERAIQVLKEDIMKHIDHFERDSFIESFTDYVVSKRMSKTLQEIYSIRFPEARILDKRRILMYFYGQNALVDYSMHQKLSMLVDKEYFYEFAALYLLNAKHRSNPLDVNSEKKHFLVQNALDHSKYTVYSKRVDLYTPWSDFMTALIIYLKLDQIKIF